MARVPLTKTERKNLKAQRRAGLSGGVMLDDFADDVADLIQVALLYVSVSVCSSEQVRHHGFGVDPLGLLQSCHCLSAPSDCTGAPQDVLDRHRLTLHCAGLGKRCVMLAAHRSSC